PISSSSLSLLDALPISIDFLLNVLSMTNLLMTGLLVFSTILLLAGFMHYGDSIDQNLQKMNTDTKRAQVPSIYQRVSQRLSCHRSEEHTSELQSRFDLV